MDFAIIKHNLSLISEEIKKSKYFRNYFFKTGEYYKKAYLEKSNESDRNTGFSNIGKASLYQSQFIKMKTQARAYNILYAFTKGRRFDTVEKYYYNNGIQKQTALLLKSEELTSKYEEAKARQQLAIDTAKISMGYFKYIERKSKMSRYLGYDKKATEWKEFEEWISKTGNTV